MPCLYTEEYFLEHGVRYIAVNDNVDTMKDDNDIAPFKNILNEMYAKDISRKIRSARAVSAGRESSLAANRHLDIPAARLISIS